ncbi:MAG TPA: hypothetical protein VGP06_03285 [Janthinobacterium sp.]|nr:hypothetical protein [Janthinobacterium sp.]
MKPALLRQFLNVAVVLGLILGILAACTGERSQAGNKAVAPPARTSAEYVLSVGQSVAIAPSFTLKLDRVNDSRCKTGAVCVWAGYLSFSFTLDSPNGPSSFVLSDSMPGASKSATLQGLRFTLVSVQPDTPPALDQPAPTYRVTLKVAII